MKKEAQKPKGKFSKFILGAVIGSAVGSILGAALTPQSGRQLRGKVAKHSKKTWDRVKRILEPGENAKPAKGFWHFLHRIFFKGKK